MGADWGDGDELFGLRGHQRGLGGVVARMAFPMLAIGLRLVLFEEVDQSPARDKIAEEQVAGAKAVEAICMQIRDQRPGTLAGLGVLALAAAAMNEEDVDEEFTSALVAQTLRLAGVRSPFDGGEEAVQS